MCTGGDRNKVVIFQYNKTRRLRLKERTEKDQNTLIWLSKLIGSY